MKKENQDDFEIVATSEDIDRKLQQLNENNWQQPINLSSDDFRSADLAAETPRRDENAELTEFSNELIKKYNEQFGTDISYGNWKDFVSRRAKLTKKERDVEDAVMEDLNEEMTKYLKDKFARFYINFISNQLNAMMRTEVQDDVSEISLAVIDRMEAMRKVLDKLSSLYKSSGDIEKRVENIKGKKQTVFDEETRKLINMLKSSVINKTEDTKAPF